MTGKTCLVTGGTSGIGLGAALELARRGATVVIVGREPARCEAAVRTIRQAAGGDSATSLCGDLSSLAEVRRLAGEFLERHDRLDVLINNAGALFALRRESADGIEMTLALNHLSPFLLTNLLLERIRASAPARIINVSSDSHEMVKGFDFDDPQASRGRYGQSEATNLFYTLLAPRAHPGLLQYARTKLANLLFTRELARRLGGTRVTVNAVHPGFVATGFSAGNGSYGWFMRRGASLFGISAEEGAATLVQLAASPDVKDTSGAYFVKQKVVRPSGAAEDDAAAQRLWEVSEQLTGLAR